MKSILFFGPLRPDTLTELGSGAIRYVGRFLSLVFTETYSILRPSLGIHTELVSGAIHVCLAVDNSRQQGMLGVSSVAVLGTLPETASSLP